MHQIIEELYTIVEDEHKKVFKSKDVNFIFNKDTGFTATWGKTLIDDPDYCKDGPCIADIEVTSICEGPSGTPCNFCYKSNTKDGKNMTLDTFKKIFDKLPPTVCQIAFGADAKAESNPDLFSIMKYTRDNGVIPNITVANITPETADKLVEVCGAVAVSCYYDKNLCYDSVKLLTDRGLTQTNIHFLLADETRSRLYETLSDIKNDKRLKKLHAIVMLSLKPKGRGSNLTRLSDDNYNELINILMESGINFGFDSCGCQKFLSATRGRSDFKKLELVAESCESTLFSAYINVDGYYSPCSFTDTNNDISVLKAENFVDVWMHPKTVEFREKLLANTDSHGIRYCPVYKV